MRINVLVKVTPGKTCTLQNIMICTRVASLFRITQVMQSNLIDQDPSNQENCSYCSNFCSKCS